MANVTPGYTWASGNTVTAALLNQAVADATVTNIVNADIDNNAAIALSKLATGALPTGITVATANLVAATQQALVPVGAIVALAHGSVPSGWLICNGGEYAKTGTYAALFAVIGTYYGETNGSGGAGTSHFRVPNLQGIFIRGHGAQTIGGTTYTSGAFGVGQQDAFKSHQHSYTDENWEGPGAQAIFGSIGAFRDTKNKTTGLTGGTETRPANIALYYCIKF